MSHPTQLLPTLAVAEDYSEPNHMVTELLEGSLSLREKWIDSMENSAHEINQSDLSGTGAALAVETIAAPILGHAFVNTDARPAAKTILLVEDETFLRNALAEALESAGYRLLVAGSANEALTAFEACPHPVDLLVTDLVMPGMDGLQLASQLEGLCPHTRVLLMSGHADQLARTERSHDDKNYLAKPFSVRTLLDRVRAALESNHFD